MYSITLQDGTVINELELNGNNYISNTVIPGKVFDRNLGKVEISDGETTEIFFDMRLMSNIEREGRSWIVLGQKTEQDFLLEAIAQQRADVDYIAIMQGVKL